MNKAILLIVGIFGCVTLFAQDPLLNQTDNSRNYLNPAYIGTEKSFSADLSYRNQWPELSGSYRTLVFQANQYLGKGNGVSVHLVNDNSANTVLKTEFGAGYAKVFSFSGHHNLSLGAQASYFRKTLNMDKLTFGNQINPQQGFVYNTIEPFETEVSGVDFNTGVLYYNKLIFAGYSVKHITQPNESFFGSDGRLPILHAFQLGGKINFNKIYIIPSVRWYNQGGFNTSFVSLKFNWKKLEIDGGYNFGNGVYGGIGFYTNQFNLGYNYTLPTSGLGFSASTHEIRMGCDLSLFKKENEHFFNF